LAVDFCRLIYSAFVSILLFPKPTSNFFALVDVSKTNPLYKA